MVNFQRRDFKEANQSQRSRENDTRSRENDFLIIHINIQNGRYRPRFSKKIKEKKYVNHIKRIENQWAGLNFFQN